MASPHKLAVIGDDSLIALAQKALVRSEFPFLDGLQNMKSCGCNGNKKQGRAEKIAAAKRAIASLDPAKQSVFKKMVNAEQVQVSYIGLDGKPVKVVF